MTRSLQIAAVVVGILAISFTCVARCARSLCSGSEERASSGPPCHKSESSKEQTPCEEPVFLTSTFGGLSVHKSIPALDSIPLSIQFYSGFPLFPALLDGASPYGSSPPTSSRLHYSVVFRI